MVNYQLIGVIFLPFLLSGIVLKPEILLYFLVFDSWIITRISQVTLFYDALTFNRLIVYLGLMFIVVRRLFQRKLVPPAAKTLISIMVILFLIFCFYSYFSYMKQMEFTILNNAVFYLLALALLDNDFKRTFRGICIVIIIPVFLLSATTIFNNLMSMDFGQASYAGNRNHTSIYILTGIPFLFALREQFQRKELRFILNAIIFMGCVTVGLSLGRLVTMTLLLSLCFFSLRGYIKVQTLALVIVMVVILTVINMDVVLTYSDKLIRLPEGTRHEISHYNQEELAAVTSGRSEAYKSAWQLYKRAPFLGIGYDRWREMHKNERGSSLHSRWLQILTEGGIVGFCLYALLYVVGFWNIWKGRKLQRNVMAKQGELDAVFWALVVFLLAGITDNHGFTDRVFYLLLAMAATIGTHREHQVTSPVIRSDMASSGRTDKVTA